MSELTGEQRRRVRELALQRLYALDQKKFNDDDHLVVADGGDDDVNAAAAAAAMLDNFLAEQTPVDAVVEGCLTNWTLVRMAVVDRSLLRLGGYELLYCGDVPPKAIINEYIELAKIYGSDEKRLN